MSDQALSLELILRQQKRMNDEFAELTSPWSRPRKIALGPAQRAVMDFGLIIGDQQETGC